MTQDNYGQGEYLRDWMALTGDIGALIGRVNQFQSWVEIFNKRLPETSDLHTILPIALNAITFYESEFGAIAREASRISARATDIRKRTEDYLRGEKGK